MAFGDIVEVVESTATSSTTVSATYASATPAANDLNVAMHFTLAVASAVDTSGYTEDQLLTNGVESDEGAIYSQEVASASDDTVTCSSASSSHMLTLSLVRGAFETTPKDLSDATDRSSANPVATGASGSDTAQADEMMMAIEIIRSGTDKTDDWDREGDATPTSDMTELSGGGVSAGSFRLEGASQLLTGVGTVGISRANGESAAVLIGYATYKKSAAVAAPVTMAYWM